MSRATITTPASERNQPATTAALLAELRRALNQTVRRHEQIATAATSTAIAIYTSPVLTPGTTAACVARIVGSSATGAAYLCAEYTVAAHRAIGGSAALLGSAAAHYTPIASGAQAVTFAIVDDKLVVSVDDDGNAMTWDAWIELCAAWGNSA